MLSKKIQEKKNAKVFIALFISFYALMLYIVGIIDMTMGKVLQLDTLLYFFMGTATWLLISYFIE